MEGLYDWGLDVIAGIQQLKSPAITFLMQGISFLGDPIFYLLIVMFIFWCIDSKKGFQLGTIIIFSGAFNTAIKESLKVPRPYQRNPSVFIVEETGFSTPSGHSQGASSFYPVAGKYLFKGKNTPKQIGKLLFAILIPLLVGFSRIYLGVHYPSDVFLGLILGFLTATGVLLFWDSLAVKLGTLRISIKILILALICICLNHFSKGHTSLSGLLFGFVAGHLFFTNKKNIDVAKGSLLQKILRLILGIIIMGIAYIVPKIIISFLGFDSPDNQLYDLCRFVRYLLTGATASFVVPFLFIKFNLAKEFPMGNILLVNDETLSKKE